MISFAPIWAVVLRHIRMWKGDVNLLIGGFYWPLLDILIWGFLGSWIQQTQEISLYNYQTIALLGLLLWQLVGRGCNIIIISFCEELWSNNVVNLFSLPLHIIEWISGIIIFYAIMMLMTFAFCMLVIGMLYNVSIAYLCSTFFLFMLPLVFSAIWIGFMALQFVVLFGKRGAEVGFALGWLLMPFSGALYPTTVLPRGAQIISSWLPMSYVFQGMRDFVAHQEDPTPYLIKGYALSIVYAIIAILLFIYCFNRSKRKGLARLTD